MVLFHWRNLVQDFNQGYKGINHMSHGSTKLLWNSHCPTCDLSNHMAVLPHFDTQYWKSLWTEAVVQKRKILQLLHKYVIYDKALCLSNDLSWVSSAFRWSLECPRQLCTRIRGHNKINCSHWWWNCEEHSRTPGFQKEMWKCLQVPSTQLLGHSRYRESMRKGIEMWLEKEKEGASRQGESAGLGHIAVGRNEVWNATRTRAAQLGNEFGLFKWGQTPASGSDWGLSASFRTEVKTNKNLFVIFRAVIYIPTLLLHYAAV